MAEWRYRNVAEPVAHAHRDRPGKVVNDPDVIPDGVAERVAKMDYYDEEWVADFLTMNERHWASGYIWYLVFVFIAVAAFLYAWHDSPAMIESWVVWLAAGVALVLNTVACWHFTEGWDIDSRLVGFGGPAIAPAVVILAVLFGLIRFA